MDLRERWTRYCLKMECRACGEAIYAHEDDARADVDHILATNDFGPEPSIECLRDALTWLEHEGRWCDYHAEVMGKED
jgi:hypothetical protein